MLHTKQIIAINLRSRRKHKINTKQSLQQGQEFHHNNGHYRVVEIKK